MIRISIYNHRRHTYSYATVNRLKRRLKHKQQKIDQIRHALMLINERALFCKKVNDSSILETFVNHTMPIIHDEISNINACQNSMAKIFKDVLPNDLVYGNGPYKGELINNQTYLDLADGRKKYCGHSGLDLLYYLICCILQHDQD